MSHIEKKVFHEDVFEYCSRKLEEIPELKSDSIEHLMDKLRVAKQLLRGIEKDYLIAFNSQNYNKVIKDFGILFRRLYWFFGVEGNQELFKATHQYVTRLARRNGLTKTIRQHDGEFKNKTNKERLNFTYRQEQRYFGNFYGLVRKIIEDLNEEEAWNEVNRYYSKKYLISEGNFNQGNLEAIGDKKITFLSYSFDDKAYSFHLFNHFLDNGGFLYVDSILGKKLRNAASIKESLAWWIDRSKQFLFLKSVSSFNTSIRPWCSWEIGRAYIHNVELFAVVDIIGVSERFDVLLGDFRQFLSVYKGNIECDNDE